MDPDVEGVDPQEAFTGNGEMCAGQPQATEETATANWTLSQTTWNDI